MGFNPSANRYTDNFMGLLGELAEKAEKKKLIAEKKKRIEEFKSNLPEGAYAKGYTPEGTVSGYGAPTPQEAFELQQLKKLFGGDTGGGLIQEDVSRETLPPEAAMSLPGGGVGDVAGKAVSTPKPRPPGLVAPKGYDLPESITLGGVKFPKKKANALTGEQEVKARALAQQLFKTRGAQQGFPAVAKLMSEGKTVDEIEDIVRFSRQSEQFTGALRSAAQEVLISTSPAIAERSLDFIDDELSKGNISSVKSKLKRIARKSSGTELSRNIMGKERTHEFLTEIQDNLDALAQQGFDTNIFTGSLEQINKKIGRVNNPEARKVATKIATAIQSYRRSMSGVAFSVPESQEYKDIFPSIGKTANFNKATIQALQETMKGDLDNFYSLSMGPENYQQLFGEIPQVSGPTRPSLVNQGSQQSLATQQPSDDEYNQYLKIIGAR